MYTKYESSPCLIYINRDNMYITYMNLGSTIILFIRLKDDHKYTMLML